MTEERLDLSIVLCLVGDEWCALVDVRPDKGLDIGTKGRDVHGRD